MVVKVVRHTLLEKMDLRNDREPLSQTLCVRGKKGSEVRSDSLGASVKGAGLKGEPFYSEDELLINKIKSTVT